MGLPGYTKQGKPKPHTHSHTTILSLPFPPPPSPIVSLEQKAVLEEISRKSEEHRRYSFFLKIFLVNFKIILQIWCSRRISKSD